MYSSFGYDFFGFRGSATIQNLLNKSDLTLDELLEEDGLNEEVKRFNKRLVDFLTENSIFRQLIKNVIVEATVEDAQTNRKKSFKYPFTCAEILGSDSKQIVTTFFKKTSEIKPSNQKSGNVEYTTNKNTDKKLDDSDEVNLDESIETPDSPDSDKENKVQDADAATENDDFEYLDYLFTFLDGEEVNFTAAGYFAKILNNLYSKNPSELLSYLYETRPAILEKMVNHISSKSIAEFLSKILSFETAQVEDSPSEVYDNERIKTLSLIIKRLDAKYDIETINNSAFLVCEVFGKYSSMHNGYEILGSLLEAQTIEYLFEILNSKSAASSCAVALILGNVFAYYILINSPRYDEYGQIIEDSRRNELSDEIPLFKAMIEHIPSIISYLGSTDGGSFTSQYGASVVPLGSAKLKLIELLIIAIKTNNVSVHAKLAHCELLETLLSLLLKYEFNNMLHNQVEKVVLIALESHIEHLKFSLFERADILNFIVRASRQTDASLPGKHQRKVRKGYMAQIVRISNRLIESQDPYVLGYMERNNQWKEYVESQLMETNTKYSVNFGGRDPRDPRNEYDDTEDEQIEIENQESQNAFTMNNNGRYYSNNNDQDDDDDEDDDENDRDDEEVELAEQEEGFRDDFDDEDVDEKENEEIEQVTGFYATLGSDKLSQELLKCQDLAEDGQSQETAEKTESEALSTKSEIVDLGEALTEDEGESNFNPNVYLKRNELVSAQDVLKELELL